MLKRKNAIVRTKKYGKLVRLSLIFAVVAIIAGIAAYGWQEYEEKKYPEGTEMDYSLPNAFLSFARLISDFMTQNAEEEQLSDSEQKEPEDEEDNIIVVGDDTGDTSIGTSSEEEQEPEIRGGIVEESDNEGYYSFNDSLFVGDYFVSQAQNLKFFEYTDYACVTGLDMNTVLTKKVLKNEEGEMLTLADYVAEVKNPRAIYIMFSAESISWMDCPTFVKKYTAFVDMIIEAHPEAHIYIQPIFPINEEKASKRGYSVTNEKIDEINGYIYSIAEERSLWMLDMADIFTGKKETELPAELTTNGIRFEKATYEIWADYIVTHKAH
ncbi:MAG: hypothetical protein IJ306_08110 [Oscillospiraceae bacterium]|nr:hypothetical protein [Oscillospiraceae bacterium]